MFVHQTIQTILGKICISCKSKYNYCTEKKWQKNRLILLNLKSEIGLFWPASSGKPRQCVEWLRCLCLRKTGIFLWQNTSATRQRACNVEVKNPLMRRHVMPLHLQTRKATQAPPATVPVPVWCQCRMCLKSARNGTIKTSLLPPANCCTVDRRHHSGVWRVISVLGYKIARACSQEDTHGISGSRCYQPEGTGRRNVI